MSHFPLQNLRINWIPYRSHLSQILPMLYVSSYIHTCSDLVDAIDANEAEIYSSLIGCRALKILFGFKAIVEGILSRLFSGDP